MYQELVAFMLTYVDHPWQKWLQIQRGVGCLETVCVGRSVTLYMNV